MLIIVRLLINRLIITSAKPTVNAIPVNGVNKAGKQARWLACKRGGTMVHCFGGQQLPREATARLKKTGYNRKVSEEASHEVIGEQVEVTFLSASSSGGISRWTMSLVEFRQNFSEIRRKK